MAGLNSMISDTQQTSTTMPSWYDAAQQQIINQGSAAAGAAPQLGQTTAQGAINTLQGANNPFSQAQNTLQQISSGAANPWITDASGNVTPNTKTALGGLFSAQQNQLNQLLPSAVAPTQAAGIGSGGFGGLRAQTAVDKARADALATLQAQQMNSALLSQQYGTAAATGLGDVGQKGINAAMNVGQAQMNAPFTNVSNYANLLGSLQVPTTTTSQVQYSPLSQAATLANTLQGAGGAGGLGSLLFGTAAKGVQGTSGYVPAQSGLFGSTGLTSLTKDLKNWFSGVGGPSGTQAGTYPLEGGGSVILNSDGSKTIVGADGARQYFDTSGNPTTVSKDLQDQNIIPAGDKTNLGGSDTSQLDQLIQDTQNLG